MHRRHKVSFRFDQFKAAVEDVRDDKWLFQAYVKIHGTVIQRSQTYKKLFTAWRDKGSKAGVGRLTEQEMAEGLKRLKAGLNQEEIVKLAQQLPYGGKDPRDRSIGFNEFEQVVKEGVARLEGE